MQGFFVYLFLMLRRVLRLTLFSSKFYPLLLYLVPSLQDWPKIIPASLTHASEAKFYISHSHLEIISSDLPLEYPSAR